jgi:hypothetical protein
MTDMNDMPDMADTYHYARRIQLWKQEAMHCRAVFENKISKLYGASAHLKTLKDSISHSRVQ